MSTTDQVKEETRDKAESPDQKPVQASGKAKESGPGTKAAQELLSSGEQKPENYARIIREYPTEKAPILGAIQSSILGNTFAQQVAEEIDSLDLSVEDKRLSYVDKDDGDYFVADQKRKGAEFRKGDTTGTLNKDGLTVQHPTGEGKHVEGNLNVKDKNVVGKVDHVDGESRYGVGGYVDPKNASTHGVDVHGKTKVGEGTGDAKVGLDSKDGKVSTSGEVGYADKEKSGRLKAKYTDGDNFDLGASGKHKVSGGSLSEVRGGVGYGEKDGAGTVRGNAGVTTAGGHTVDGTGKYTDGDNYSLGLSGNRKLDGDSNLSMGLGYDVAGGSDTLRGNLGYKTPGTNSTLSGAYTDEDNYGLSLGHQRKLGEHTDLTGSLSHNRKDGVSTTTGEASAKYATDDLLLSGSMGASYGDDGLGYNAKGEGLGTLSSGMLYAEGFGGVQGGGAMDEPQFHLGGGLVLTPNEKMALTLSGAIDQSGGFDTRLQFDLFKKKVYNARGLSKAKQESAVSIFVGYKQGMDNDIMGDRYGSGQFGHEEGQAYLGVGFKF